MYTTDCPRKREEGGDDVKSAWPLRLGPHTCYNGAKQWVAKPQGGANPNKTPLSSDCGLQLARMKLESLVNANQPRCVEYVLGSCTRVLGSYRKKLVQVQHGVLERHKQNGRRALARVALKGRDAFHSLSSQIGA